MGRRSQGLNTGPQSPGNLTKGRQEKGRAPGPPGLLSTFTSPPPRLLPTPIFGLVEQTLCKVLPGLVSVRSPLPPTPGCQGQLAGIPKICEENCAGGSGWIAYPGLKEAVRPWEGGGHLRWTQGGSSRALGLCVGTWRCVLEALSVESLAVTLGGVVLWLLCLVLLLGCPVLQVTPAACSHSPPSAELELGPPVLSHPVLRVCR